MHAGKDVSGNGAGTLRTIRDDSGSIRDAEKSYDKSRPGQSRLHRVILALAMAKEPDYVLY